MSRERAKSYADRLPPLVPREEDDISHLSDEMADLLYPGRRPRPPRVGFVFEAVPGEDPALPLARRAPVYREEADGPVVRHRAEFGTGEAAAARALFELVGQRPGTEVLVDGKAVPYARELWLPLYWIFVVDEARG